MNRVPEIKILVQFSGKDMNRVTEIQSRFWVSWKFINRVPENFFKVNCKTMKMLPEIKI